MKKSLSGWMDLDLTHNKKFRVSEANSRSGDIGKLTNRQIGNRVFILFFIRKKA